MQRMIFAFRSAPAIALSLAAACLCADAARAEALRQSEVLQARVLPGWQTPSGSHMAALELTLAPDWKTYWRSPGDAGIPPFFDWSASDNLAGVLIHWPRPEVFHLNGMQSIGYKRRLVLPVELVARDAGAPIHLRASIDLGICRDICMPASLSVDALVAGKGAPDPAISAALADRPQTGREAGLGGIACTVQPISDGLRLTASMRLPPTGGAEAVVFEPGRGAVWVSEAVVTRQGDTLTAEADLVPETAAPFVLDRSRVVVTVLGEERAVEIRGCPAP
jgi:DsbC/DsbD-like thiol-disulfide interchange protein